MTTVSVVIPVFERQAQGIEALRSALAQIGAKDEIVIVDDGSKEPFWLPDYAAADPRVTLIRHDINRGAAAARNTGIKAALGTWMFLDPTICGCRETRCAAGARARSVAGPGPLGDRTGFRRLDAVNGGQARTFCWSWRAPSANSRRAAGSHQVDGLLPVSAFDRLGGFDRRSAGLRI